GHLGAEPSNRLHGFQDNASEEESNDQGQNGDDSEKSDTSSAYRDRLRLDDLRDVGPYVDDSTHRVVCAVTDCAFWKVDQRSISPEIGLASSENETAVIPEEEFLASGAFPESIRVSTATKWSSPCLFRLWVVSWSRKSTSERVNAAMTAPIPSARAAIRRKSTLKVRDNERERFPSILTSLCPNHGRRNVFSGDYKAATLS